MTLKRYSKNYHINKQIKRERINQEIIYYPCAHDDKKNMQCKKAVKLVGYINMCKLSWIVNYVATTNK